MNRLDAAIAAYLATHEEPGNIVTPAIQQAPVGRSKGPSTARARFSGSSSKYGRFTPGKGKLS